jgi:hypothetical protein
LPFFRKQGVPFGFDGPELVQQHFQSIEFTQYLTLHVIRKRASITRLQCLEPLSAIASQRIVADDPLRKEKSLDPVAVPDALLHQHLALAHDRRRSSSTGDGTRNMEQTPGSPRLKASKARMRSPHPTDRSSRGAYAATWR